MFLQYLVVVLDVNTNFLSEIKNIEMRQVSTSPVVEASQRINLPMRTFCDSATVLLVTET